MISLRLKKFLDQQQVPYETHIHRTAYTAQQVAAEEHVPGRMMAKTIIVESDGQFLMVVLPAPRKVDMSAVRISLYQPRARLATEAEFNSLFPDSETGAMPPFGNLYGMAVYVDPELAHDPSGVNEIVFNAGTHRETIRMNYSDFRRLASPMVMPLAARDMAA
jgi:Ala-tRNA(Pro) deacylase